MYTKTDAELETKSAAYSYGYRDALNGEGYRNTWESHNPEGKAYIEKASDDYRQGYNDAVLDMACE